MEFIIGVIVVYVLYKLFSNKSTVKTSANNSRSGTQSKHSKNSNFSVAAKSSTLDDDDFATFTIHTSFGREPEKTTNKQKGRWISEDEQLSFNGRQLTKGFFYFGGAMNSLDGYGIEPSLVDDKRPASSPSVDSEIYTDESLGYWPSYASLSKGCRGAYLDWLASDRSNSNTPIGYVFIYFYGFERRVIENKSNNQISDEEYLSLIHI